MRINFDHAMRFLFWCERYHADTPGDPGGLTIWGITSRDFPTFVGKMQAMTQAQSKEYAANFYLAKFWVPAGCDDLTSPLDIVIFDIAVNQGPTRAKSISEAAANWWDALILRSDCYDDLKLYSKFGRGWNRMRVVSLRDYITSGFAMLEEDRKDLLPAKKAETA